MKRIIFYTILFCFYSFALYANSSLPECKGTNQEKWTNCKGTQLLGTDRKYIGEFKDGKRDGNGTLINPDGSKYIGQWKNGLPDGKGSETWMDGTKYSGKFKAGKKIGHGEGSLIYPDGSKFT
jgi:hypothetical protein